MKTRPPYQGEYVDPQPVAVDTEGDEIAPLPNPNYLNFPSILADAIEEAGGSARPRAGGSAGLSALNAHELANAVRLAEARWRHRSAPDSDA